MVLSYETWQARFGGRPDVVGTAVSFDKVPWTIVGIAPKGLTLERGKPGPAFWIPAGQDANDISQQNHNFRSIARLKPGVTMEQAAVETTRLLQGSTPPEKRGVRLQTYQREETREVRQPLLLLLAAVGVLLLVACVNIATMLLGEGAARQTELGTRLALGASRARIIRQLLTESLVLSLAGGAAGAVLAWWGTKLIVAMAPDRVPGIRNVAVDGRVLGMAFAAAAVTGLAFGLLPALATSHGGGFLRGGGQSRRGRDRLQKTLIAVELSLSLVLMVGAALLARSLWKLTAVDPGFRSERLLVARVSLASSTFTNEARAAFYGTAATRLAALPGIEAVTAAANGVPFTGSASSSGYFREGETDMKQRRTAGQRDVLPNYFSMMSIPILSGRAFGPEDGPNAPLVAIISETAARRDWPNESPIGQRVTFQGAVRTIVGVVADSKYDKLSADAEATIFTPHAQRPGGATFLIRTRGTPVTMIPTVRETLRGVAPATAVGTIDVMDELIRRSYGEERFRTALIVLFGAMASVLAAVGMYGVTSRAVNGRIREVGIRVALGATTASVIRLIVQQTLGGVVIGVAIGVVGAFAATRLLAPYLFGVAPHDPLTYAGTIALLAFVSVVASWIPARRAGRVHPAVVLRGE
jgi:putative ABC transport system permease protein